MALSLSDTRRAVRIDDAQLLRQITAELRRTDRLAYRDVQATIRNGHVRLTGRVGSWYLKQLAQSAVMSLDGVESLVNEILVT